MKKRFICLILTIVLGFGMQNIFCTYAQNDVKVILNGKEITFDQPPVIENGRTLVPARAVFEAMGAKVNWFEDEKRVFIQKNKIEIVLNIGKTNFFACGLSLPLDVPAKILNGRTLVPLRAVSESMGALVNWNGETKTVEIFYSDNGSNAPVIYNKENIYEIGFDFGRLKRNFGTPALDYDNYIGYYAEFESRPLKRILSKVNTDDSNTTIGFFGKLNDFIPAELAKENYSKEDLKSLFDIDNLYWTFNDYLQTCAFDFLGKQVVLYEYLTYYDEESNDYFPRNISDENLFTSDANILIIKPERKIFANNTLNEKTYEEKDKLTEILYSLYSKHFASGFYGYYISYDKNNKNVYSNSSIIDFAVKYNINSETVRNDGYFCIPIEQVAETADKFFGVDVPVEMPKLISAIEKIEDGYYWYPMADGEFNGALFLTNMIQNNDTYTVEFMILDFGIEYGTAVVKEKIYNGEKTYEIIQYSIDDNREKNLFGFDVVGKTVDEIWGQNGSYIRPARFYWYDGPCVEYDHIDLRLGIQSNAISDFENNIKGSDICKYADTKAIDVFNAFLGWKGQYSLKELEQAFGKATKEYSILHDADYYFFNYDKYVIMIFDYNDGTVIQDGENVKFSDITPVRITLNEE